LISYSLTSREQFQVEECNEGSGAACGAIFLNKLFESLVREKLGDRAKTIPTPKRINKAIRFFESTIKRSFNPLDPTSCDEEYEIPLSGAKDVSQIGLEDGCLGFTLSIPSPHFHRAEIQDTVYAPIFQQIYELINQQMVDVETKGGGKLKGYIVKLNISDGRPCYLSED